MLRRTCVRDVTPANERRRRHGTELREGGSEPLRRDHECHDALARAVLDERADPALDADGQPLHRFGWLGSGAAFFWIVLRSIRTLAP
jgi:hypothetical protein